MDINEELVKEVLAASKENEITCQACFEVADSLNEQVALVGVALDDQGIRIVECQLGLFGYKPDKKRVEPVKPDDPSILDAVKQSSLEGAIKCSATWELADRFKTEKQTISDTCQYLNIKITNCRLGAF